MVNVEFCIGVITLPDGQGGVIIKSKFMGFEERLENLGELKSLEGIANYILVVNNLLRKGWMKSVYLEYKNSQTTQEDLSGVYNPITQEQIYISVIPKQTKDGWAHGGRLLQS
jgi:hypothetical protein